MTANQIKIRAWTALTGKWGTYAAMILLYSLIMLVLSLLSIVGIGAIGILILVGPFTVGFAITALHVARKEEISVSNMFGGFKLFGKALALDILNNIFVFLWSLIFYFPGIVKSYSYSMSYYILADNPGMSQAEARRESVRMMRGHKWHLFCLHWSFLGWFMIVVPLTFGIFTFWLVPYMQTANAVFYENLKREEREGMPAPQPYVPAPAQPYITPQPSETVVVTARCAPMSEPVKVTELVEEPKMTAETDTDEQATVSQPVTEEMDQGESKPGAVEILLDDDDDQKL
ncbi:MAG: DUF975 family protein [Clostridia bacterium]|nr:DUF975 family protein [Clostridia bacterium]